VNERRKDKSAGLQQGEWRTGKGREPETAAPSDAGKVKNSARPQLRYWLSHWS
jgi:hypothetical protein